jgi:hypothetical protein
MDSGSILDWKFSWRVTDHLVAFDAVQFSEEYAKQPTGEETRYVPSKWD